MSNEPIFSSLTQWSEAIRTRSISAYETLKIHLAQIDKYNPALNVINVIDPEKALKRARAADEAAARGESWGPLHGVPFTLKDAHCTAGMRTTVGFPPFADYVPEEDSTVAARLRLAGGILFGKTNVATMLGDYQTSNQLFGHTNNPWNLERTPGGSSGGAAAALAAGMTPFEIGTDLSSSIRVPAHFCGIFGLKPTERRVPLTGLMPNPQHLPWPIRMMNSIGPMARSVEDLELIYSIIAGSDGRDSDVQPVPQVRVSAGFAQSSHLTAPAKGPALKGLIAVLLGYFGDSMVMDTHRVSFAGSVDLAVTLASPFISAVVPPPITAHSGTQPPPAAP